MFRYPLWISLRFTWLYNSSLYSILVAEIYLFSSFSYTQVRNHQRIKRVRDYLTNDLFRETQLLLFPNNMTTCGERKSLRSLHTDALPFLIYSRYSKRVEIKTFKLLHCIIRGVCFPRAPSFFNTIRTRTLVSGWFVFSTASNRIKNSTFFTLWTSLDLVSCTRTS
jgi:hypothetical protein